MGGPVEVTLAPGQPLDPRCFSTR